MLRVRSAVLLTLRVRSAVLLTLRVRFGRLGLTRSVRSTALLDAVQVRLRAYQQRLARNGRRGHAAGVETVGGQELELPAVGQDDGLAVLVEDVDPAIGPDGRGGVVAADPLVPEDLAGAGTTQEAMPRSSTM